MQELVIRDVEDINPSAKVNKIDKNRVQVKCKTVSEMEKRFQKIISAFVVELKINILQVTVLH